VTASGSFDWARLNSPVLSRLDLDDHGTLAGRHIAILAPLDAGTAVLATKLAETADAVTVLDGGGVADIDDTFGSMLAAQERVAVHLGSVESWEPDTPPDLVIDQHGRLTIHLANHAPALHRDIAGAVESSARGAEVLRSTGVGFPVFATHHSACVRLVERDRGARVVQAILRLTNLRMAGSRVAVIGYGPVGRSVAHTAAALGATVTVIEADSVATLQAHFDGHSTGDRSQLARASILVTTGGARVDVTELADGAVLAHADLNEPRFMEFSNGEATEVRPGVTAIPHPGGVVHLLGPVGGRSLDEADVIGAVTALALARLVSDPPEVGVHRIPDDIDTEIARLALAVTR
jgi:adenosylhomocysteinase